jgi:hypothetical protein
MFLNNTTVRLPQVVRVNLECRNDRHTHKLFYFDFIIFIFRLDHHRSILKTLFWFLTVESVLLVNHGSVNLRAKIISRYSCISKYIFYPRHKNLLFHFKTSTSSTRPFQSKQQTSSAPISISLSNPSKECTSSTCTSQQHATINRGHNKIPRPKQTRKLTPGQKRSTQQS